MNEPETFVGDEPKSSAGILSALNKAEAAFNEWQATCETIDRIYNLDGQGYGGMRADLASYGWQDSKLDLFWASYEILKPAVYARPPQPVVAPLFKDNRRLPNTTAELLERAAISVFKRTDMNSVMLQVRDDVLFAGRGAMWLRYETEDGEKKVCVEHKDRLDFLHEPCRYWSEVGWVAAASWLTKKDMRKRFGDEIADDANYTVTDKDERGNTTENRATSPKCKVWEVWHRADNRIYWVTEGVEDILDQMAPGLKLDGFFPCPRPAFGTTRRRSLIPVPDWERYAIHFQKISRLTARIYLLLDQVKLMGFISGGGDIADAVEEALSSDDDQMTIRVNTMGNISEALAWLPLNDTAQAIQGLIEARNQLIQDFYQLSGISDIMRGATESDETLGAQQLKSQFGSVRVREKSQELQRIAADAVKVAAEIIAEKFDKEQLLAMSQMEIPTKAAIDKRIKDVEKAAQKDLDALAKKAQQAAQSPEAQQADPAQAKGAFEQAQQQILAKYAPLLAEAEQQVPIEEVMKMLRDDRTRNFTFEIETSSTILTDELQEKQSRNEFMAEFTSSSQALIQMAAMGEEGAKLAGEMMKFVLAPYRAGRTLDGAIDAFIDAAPEMAKRAAAANGQEGESEDLAKAQQALADAEKQKAQAAMAQVQANAALKDAENKRKIAELEQKAQNDNAKLQQENGKLSLQVAQMELDAQEQRAKIDNLTAQTAKILASIGLDERKQQLSEYQAAEQAQNNRVNQAMAIEGQEQDAAFRSEEAERASRGEDRADRQQDFSERSSDRQQDFAEQQAQREGGE